jgi:hypothetical protein
MVVTKDCFKTLNKKEEEGGATIGNATNGGTITRILILKSKPRYSISEPSREKALSRGLQNPNPWREVKSVVIHIYLLALH